MTEAIGAQLQQAREAQGLSVSEVAQQLKFAPRQLEAIEQDRFDLLPGGTFARGMVRSYARLLKIDPQPLVAAIASRFDAPDAAQLAARYSQPVPFSDSARRSTFVYLGLSLGVLALGGGIAFQWYHEHNAAARLAAAKKAVAPQARLPAELPAKTQLAKIAKTASPKPAERAPKTEIAAKLSPAKEAAPPKATPAKMAAAAPAAEKVAAAKSAEKAAPPKLVAAAAGVNRLVIRCAEEAWIEVRDASDRMLVSSLNPKGCERVVQSRSALTLVIGNAEHVQVLHNGKPLDLAPYTKSAIARFSLP